jgi:transposase-like protein
MKKKTRTTRVYNPDLDEYEWREVETDKYVFDETDKIAIAREYHERGCPASEIVSKYHISSAVVLYGWLDKYLNEKVCVSLQPETDNETDMSRKSKQQLEEELKAMKAELRRLQEALELEKLRSRAYDTMIDVAEANFNIPIRKKAGTKQ